MKKEQVGRPTAGHAWRHTYAISGDKKQSQRLLSELMQLAQREYVPSFNIALVSVALDQKERAFAWLNKAIETHDFQLTWLRDEPRFDPLHTDPRFGDLLRRMGLQP